MKRPLEDKRPIGPFAQIGKDPRSERTLVRFQLEKKPDNPQQVGKAVQQGVDEHVSKSTSDDIEGRNVFRDVWFNKITIELLEDIKSSINQRIKEDNRVEKIEVKI